MRSITTAQRAPAVAVTDLIHGECLCGDIAFEFTASHQHGTDRAMGVCHCACCRRWSGSSGVPFVVAAPERFRFTRGQELMARYRGRGRSVRAFCRRCGSSLYTEAGMTYHVSAGVLDDLSLTPSFHIHVADKAPWDEIAGDAPQFAETPTAR